MTREDYSKYYIQGSDHYLIPKYVFKELFNEMNNWKEESKQLKEQLEASEKARKKCLNKLKLLGKFDGEKFTRSFTLWVADFNDLSNILDIDKGK